MISQLQIKALLRDLGGLGVNKTSVVSFLGWGVRWVKKTLLLKEGSHMKGV